MKILQISTIGLPVSPDLKYGGTERVIRYLDKVYTDLGHESLVAAPGDSEVCGELIETIPKSTWNLGKNGQSQREVVSNPSSYSQHYRRCIEALLNNKDIDIVHDHPGAGLIISKEYEKVMNQIDIPLLMTLHGAFEENNSE